MTCLAQRNQVQELGRLRLRVLEPAFLVPTLEPVLWLLHPLGYLCAEGLWGRPLAWVRSSAPSGKEILEGSVQGDEFLQRP